MTVVVAIINLLAIGFLAWRRWRQFASHDTAAYWLGFATRLAGGIALGLVYKYYYRDGSDTFTFFQDATQLARLFFEHPGQWLEVLATGVSPVPLETVEPRSVFFVAIVSVVTIATACNYWVASMWFASYAFHCAYFCVRTLDNVLGRGGWAARAALLFFPSVVFWSSGIIKETLALGSIAIIASYFIMFLNGKKLFWWQIVFAVVHLFLLISLKYYWAAILIPSMVASLIIYWMRTYVVSFTATVAVWIAVYLGITVIATFTHPNFYLARLVSVIVENHNQYMRISDPANVIRFIPLDGSWTNLLLNAPLAWWSAWFRPGLWEAHSWTGWLAAIENCVVFVLVVWRLRYLRIPSQGFQLIVITTLTYAIVLAVFLALSTPNFGTLSRYRVGFLPFLVLLTAVDLPIRRVAGSK